MSSANGVRRSEAWRRCVAARFAIAFGRDRVRCRRRFSDEATPDIDAPGFWIECASAHEVDTTLVFLEADAHSRGSGLWPLAVTRLHGRAAIVQMRLDDFTELLLEWWSAKEHGARADVPNIGMR